MVLRNIIKGERVCSWFWGVLNFSFKNGGIIIFSFSSYRRERFGLLESFGEVIYVKG